MSQRDVDSERADGAEFKWLHHALSKKKLGGRKRGGDGGIQFIGGKANRRRISDLTLEKHLQERRTRKVATVNDREFPRDRGGMSESGRYLHSKGQAKA